VPPFGVDGGLPPLKRGLAGRKRRKVDNLDEKRPATVFVSLSGDFVDVGQFSVKLENAVRKFVAAQYAEGHIDKPRFVVGIEEPTT
jgi:hypothetical protein